MLDKSKQVHRPERLRGYDYSRPGYYLVTLTTKIRGENILCSIEGKREAEAPVGPAPLGRPIPRQQPDPQIPQQPAASSDGPLVRLTPAGGTVRELIERIPAVYRNAGVDCYTIMPDHVHMVIWLRSGSADGVGVCREGGDGPAGGPGPTGLPGIVGAVKSLTTRRLGESIWQDHYYDHIIRSQEELRNVRQYIQNNPLQWLLNQEHDGHSP